MFRTFRPLRMISTAATELNVACATNGGRRLPVRWKRAHRVIARIKRTGRRTGSRCSRANRTEDASAEEMKIVLLGALVYTRTVGKEHSIRSTSKTIFISSALASSVLFALLHLEPVLLPVLLILAITLCALFQRTGSLLPPFVAHATFNSVAAVLII